MEQLIKKIVVGYDFSKESQWAAKTALGLAGKVGADVHAVTALPGHVDREVMSAARADSREQTDRDVLYSNEPLLKSVEGRMDGAFGALKAGLDVDVSCEASAQRPTQAILETADLYEGDLLVVGATGQSALERMLMGSVSSRLVRHSRWPVLVVKGDKPAPKRILCAVDFSAASRRALGWAGELAQLYGAHVDVLYVKLVLPRQWMGMYVDPSEMPMAESQHVRDDTDELMERLKAFCDIDDLKGVSWEPRVLSGQPEEVIVEVAKRLDVDLLCMGSVGRSGVEGFLLGNTAERVMRELPCSMLAAKPDDFVLQS